MDNNVEDNYTTLMRQLQEKDEITPDDYDTLLQLESRMNDKKDAQQIQLSLSSYLGMALKDQTDGQQAKRSKNGDDGKCCVCE